MNEAFQQIIAYLRDIWRFRWVALIAAWIVSLAGWAYVTQIPDEYRSSAQVHVDSDSVLRPLLSGLAVEPNLNQRVEMMTRTLLTRPTLEKVARATDMHLAVTTEADMADIIENLRTRVALHPLTRGQDLYDISYTSRDPRLAYDVVQTLLNEFAEGLMGGARADGEMAQRFLDQQIGEQERRLEAAEQRLAEFRRQNAGLLPGVQGDYYQRLQGVQEELRMTELQLREAANRRDEIQRQLASGDTNTVSAVSLTPALDNRIHTLQTRLDELNLNFTDRHPDIISLTRTLEQLEQQRIEALEQLRVGMQTGALSLDGNPLYEQMRLALSQAQVEVSALQVRAEDHRRRIDEVQRLMDTVPQVEAELKQLDRDYDVNQQNYVELLRRRERAALSQEVEDRGEQLQFRVIEPARVPHAPAAPNRPMLSAATLLLGLGFGAGLAFLGAQLRPVFDDRRILSSVTGFPVLGTVSLGSNARRSARERVEMLLFASLSAGLLVVFGTVLLLGGIHLQILERVFA